MVKYNFQTFDKHSTPLTAQPMVTLQRRGLLSLNRAAQQALGRPDTVQALYDTDGHAIRLQRPGPTASNTYRIHPNRDEHGYRLSLVAFCNRHGIDTTKSVRYVPVVLDGVLVIELDKPIGDVTRPKPERK